MRLIPFLFLLILGLSSCRDPQYIVVRPDPIPPDTLVQEKKGIIFIGHCYFRPDRIAPRLEPIDYSRFSQVWLGGDLCSETTKKQSTITYLDSLFDLGASTTHWAVGNHDVRNGNVEWITEATGRETYYTHHEKGLTLFVMNTRLHKTECEELEAQYALFKQVCDTISESSHLILLMHNIVWSQVEPTLNPVWASANGTFASWRTRCEDSLTSQFHRVWYPELVQVQQRGVQVLCITGDFGQKATAYEYESTDGVWFLGNGLNKGIIPNHRDPNDMVIFFKHDPETRSLIWQFVKVDLLGELLGG